MEKIVTAENGYVLEYLTKKYLFGTSDELLKFLNDKLKEDIELIGYEVNERPL
jgi:hypothetical protein